MTVKLKKLRNWHLQKVAHYARECERAREVGMSALALFAKKEAHCESALRCGAKPEDVAEANMGRWVQP